MAVFLHHDDGDSRLKSHLSITLILQKYAVKYLKNYVLHKVLIYLTLEEG